MKSTLLAILTLLFFHFVVQAKTIHVPGDKPTIQKAINASMSGDTILVAPGTFVENIKITYKSLTVKSSHGPHVTVIDGGRKGSVVTFTTLDRPDTVLCGFTITNGTGTESSGYTYGGGIYCRDYASPTICGNVITGNEATNGGAGIYCMNYAGATAPLIANNIITKNRGTGNVVHGGGICCWNKVHAIITNNTIVQNHATSGGGIYCSHSSLPLVNNTILWDNTAAYGPEICISSSAHLTIDHSDVKGGKSSVYISYATLDWGNGMITYNPLFADQDAGDRHLRYNSPCRNTGTSSAPGLPDQDFEGDPRNALGNVDMGADEFHTHLYYTGVAAQNHGVNLKVVGLPGTQAFFYLGTDVLDPPLKTTFGDWYLQFPISPIYRGGITYTGILSTPRLRIPPYFPVPAALPLQAHTLDELTNLCVLVITR